MAFPRWFQQRGIRPGAAAVELATLLPFLAFLFFIAVDYSRLFYDYVTITDCARDGALYGCTDAAHAQDTTGIHNAVLADATNLQPQPTVTSMTGTDTWGNSYVEVTVAYRFSTITNFPGMPSAVNLTRTVRMRVIPP
jgi:Flp pilus assembly protein TadG